MPPTSENVPAPGRAYEIRLVERYNLSLVVARPASLVGRTQRNAGIGAEKYTEKRAPARSDTDRSRPFSWPWRRSRSPSAVFPTPFPH
jgi:hypothetical protein